MITPIAITKVEEQLTCAEGGRARKAPALWDGNEVTELREQSQILTEVIKTQQAEIQRLRAINARLMQERKRQKVFIVAKPCVHLN